MMMTHNEEIRGQIYDAVSGLSAETLNTKPAGGKWSPVQIMEHLYLMEKAITAGIVQALTASEETVTEPKPYQLTLDRSRFIDAPPHLVPTEEFIPLGDLRARLDQSRAELKAVLAESEEALWNRKVYPHPVFGLMDVAQWVDFIGIHEERHLAQLREALTQI
ncbi:DinB family protein [Paenibacillus sp. PK3_47]|uniref:DinB family protein n=1 Tax=Paenibacillus sp. PK3_47 TaxID=2072642 RepID=UPI00201DC970|nr:DinB family protein [Paenibacillus sp. PK3_47]UQZ36356.1 DinB family protein [Paenibacillus sp. PK3_47]